MKHALILSRLGGGRSKSAMTYEEVVKDLILSEKSYLRDLHMITKVFREQIQKVQFLNITEYFHNILNILSWT